jgi:mono/diheme cytochrome c family protein
VAFTLLGLGGFCLTAGYLLRRQTTLSGALLGGGAGVLLLALYLFVTTDLRSAGRSSAEPRNPYPPTAESLARGRTLYAAHCQSCHGPAGAGDGPQATGLTEPGLNLRARVGVRSDGWLFRVIGQGTRGTGMPAFIGRLTEEERWHLVNYIKTFTTTP